MSDGGVEAPIESTVVYGPRITVARIIGFVAARLIRAPILTARLLLTLITCVPISLRGMRQAASCMAIACAVHPSLAGLGISHIHAHFLNRPALVARLLAQFIGASYSLSAHARDVFVPSCRIHRLCADAHFVAVCSERARAELASHLRPTSRSKPRVCYHGVDLTKFTFRGSRDGRTGGTLRVLSVGRLVPKKGIDVVLHALAILKERGAPFTYRIAGSGSEEPTLRTLARRLDLDKAEFLGDQTTEQIHALLSWADVFVLACRVAEDGDRDGIPNSILEAMAAGVPVVATDAGGVPEVVRHLETGWLLPTNDPQVVADTLQKLADRPAMVDDIIVRARSEVELRFNHARNMKALCALLDAAREPSCAR